MKNVSKCFCWRLFGEKSGHRNYAKLRRNEKKNKISQAQDIMLHFMFSLVLY